MIDMIRNIHDSKVHGANIGPIWGRQDPGGSHVGPMKFVIWDIINHYLSIIKYLSTQMYIS